MNVITKWGKRVLCMALAVVSMLSGVSALAADTPAKAAIWQHNIWVEGNNSYARNADGKETYYLSKDGAIYVPLRTAAEWLGKDLSANGNAYTLTGSKEPVYQNQLTVDKTIYGELSAEAYQAKMEEPQTVAVIDGASLTLDGKAVDLGGKSMLRWENEVYLPVRPVAQLLGMEIKYNREKISDDPKDQRYTEELFLRTPLTDAQLQACKAYLEAVKPAARTLADSFTPMYSSIKTKADAEAAISKLLENVRTIKDAKKPDCRLIDSIYADIQARADRAIAACEQVQAQIKQMDDIEKIRYLVREDYTGETYVEGGDFAEGDDVESLMSLSSYTASRVLSPLYRIIYQEDDRS